MKDLFEIQTESGQLWLDIKAHLDAKDAELAELAASHAEAIAVKDAQLATQDAEAWNTIKADLDALGKVLVAAYAHTSKARKAKLEAELASAQAAVTAAADKLAAL